MGKRRGIRQQLSQLSASDQALDKQIKSLIASKKYSTAIRKLQQGLKRNPDQKLSVNEADILLLQGKQDFKRQQYKSAETALRRALELGLYEDTYYWLGKCLLAQQQPAAALDLYESAFTQKTLPKAMGGGYFKLLILNHKTDQVERLIKSQAKRFTADQLNWAKGALALKANKPEAAVPHFKKISAALTPEDPLNVWQSYAHQCAGNLAEARTILHQSPGSRSSLRFGRRYHPAVQKLMLSQTTDGEEDLSDFLDLRDPDLPTREEAWVLEVLHLIQASDFHEAAHYLINFPSRVMTHYPDLKALRLPLMRLGGVQAMESAEPECSAEFWGSIIDEDFEPNLALNLHQALSTIDEPAQSQRIVAKLLRWVQKEAQQQPQAWPEARLNSTLAKLHCWEADEQMSLGRYRDAEKNVQAAEKLAPTHPDVLGRKGLNAKAKGDEETAIPLLKQALATGCEFDEVYASLLEVLLDRDPEAVKSVRRQFGKTFGDTTVDTEVEIPAWVEALSVDNYQVMAEVIEDAKPRSPAIQALEIFLNAADDEPSSGQKVTLNVEKAVPRWEKLLNDHLPEQQVEIIEAIYLTIQKYAKRNKKGIAALQKSYLAKIADLAAQRVPKADLVHLVILAVRSPSPERTHPVVESILTRAAQPGNALAKAQLEIRRFDRSSMLRFFIEDQLQQDPQNPLLLLASATLHDRRSREYGTLYDQGFELARRLQDAEALQAFREEDWFVSQAMTNRALGPQLKRFGDPSQIDLMDIFKRMANEAFGGPVPPEVLAKMIGSGLFGDMEEEFDETFNPFSLPLPPPDGQSGKQTRGKRSR